jgi:molybdopterin synthase catalytic subunit
VVVKTMLTFSLKPLENYPESAPFLGMTGCKLEFAGIVRDAPEDNHVLGIEYSAYESMCVNYCETFDKSMKNSYPDIRIEIVHRLGYVPVNEISLLVRIYATHRKNCFEVLEETVEWIKQNLAVWKKIIHKDQTEEWRGNDGSCFCKHK